MTLVSPTSRLEGLLDAARTDVDNFFHLSSDLLCICTTDGHLTRINPAWTEVLGYHTEELVGQHFTRFVHADDLEATVAEFSSLLEGVPTVGFENRYRCRDGSSYRSLLWNVAPLPEKGVLYAVGRDVTERHRADPLAGRAFESARSMIESSLDSLVAISPAGRITDVNESTVKATGVPREELVGSDFSRYFTEPDRADEGYRRVFLQGSVTDYPLTMRHRDGTLTEILYNASLYRDGTGNVLGVFVAARDVTAQKQAKAELARQAKELDRLAELERFQRLTIGRELKMIELKKEIEYLKRFAPADHAELHGDKPPPLDR